MTGRPRTTQEWIHWIESGAGAGWVRLFAVLACGLVLSGFVAWKQFHGAASEATLVQADMGRELSLGRGFATRVNYPQAAAFLRERGVHFDPAVPYPELYQAPLYSLVIAAGLRLLPHSVREGLFAASPVPPDGFAADYFLLGLNVALFWLAIWLAFDLARRLFGRPAAWLSALALFVSVPVWQQVVSVDGAALMMVLGLVAFHAWWRVESSEGSPGAVPLILLGASCGALFLTEYSAGVMVVIAAGSAGRKLGRGQRWRAVAWVVAGFVILAGPWVARNLAVSGLPVGLASQNLALKAGDATAEPAVFRASFSSTAPHVDLNKVANKALSALQENLRTRIWAGGAMWFTAMFVAGWLYMFRSLPVNRIRWLFVAAFAAVIGAQAIFGSGESERQAASVFAPLIIIFGAGFFFVILGANPFLSPWPRASAAVLLALQALPLVHDVMEPRRLHFQYPPYFPGLLRGMARELDLRGASGRYGLMADVPAGLAWYGQARCWAQPATLRDFYAVQVEQPTGELLLTPKTLDRPFLSDLNAKPKAAEGFLAPAAPRIGQWGEVYGGLLTGTMPAEFPLTAPQKLAENLYVLVNPGLAGPRR